VSAAAAAGAAHADARSLTLAGPGATAYGHQVTFTGRLVPAVAGIPVGIYLGSSAIAHTTTRANGFFVARAHVFAAGDYRARAPGAVSPRHHIRVVRPVLSQGDEAAGVPKLLRRLHELGYAVVSTTETRYTGSVVQSVYAFQKAQGIAVDGVVGPQTRARLAAPRTLEPRYGAPALHIEVDLERQLVLLVRDDRVRTIINTSTAGVPGYHTPTGSFRVFRRVEGVDTSPLGELYDPLYFYRGYAIHGSTSVPPQPASHGCVRVPIWEAARLFTRIPHGETVYVY
jgi:hypothetical protein